MTSHLMRELSGYLVSRGLDNDPFACGGETHLIGSLEARAEVSSGITAGRIYEILRDFFGAVANSLEARGLREDARLLAHATTHWLRHTSGAHAIARGVRTETVAQNFGHASVATTALYTHLDDALCYDEMEQITNTQ
jgi:integrase